MEWIVVTGDTVEEAMDRALDALGVAEAEAEVEVVNDVRRGWFGWLREPARVRARVAPRRPRPKAERRDRNRRSRAKGSGRRRPKGASSGSGRQGDATSGGAGGRAKPGKPERPDKPDKPERPDKPDKPDKPVAAQQSGAQQSGAQQSGAQQDAEKGGVPMTTVTVDDQAEAGREFLEGLLEEFGMEGEVVLESVDEDLVELRVMGDDLGLLIGPKGQTLNAVQELTKTYVMRTLEGTHEGRIRVDVAQYRQRRREALERFVQQIADEVRSSGEPKSLEPMHAADRKVVHDTVNELDGVRTLSEGEEPARRVVIAPAE